MGDLGVHPGDPESVDAGPSGPRVGGCGGPSWRSPGHLLASEQGWRFLGARVAEDRALDGAWMRPRDTGTLDVVRFLLDACGGERCVQVPAEPGGA
ncbi:hypothetical protein [Nocardioides ochotonae]|uniref:hypothetical protein n=1 Tax=Nocardioides ochotonae TaxID=2685869 RepID=UPI001409E474|nr:hypothetical protein [Nocardioides ochotonae]